MTQVRTSASPNSGTRCVEGELHDDDRHDRDDVDGATHPRALRDRSPGRSRDRRRRPRPLLGSRDDGGRRFDVGSSGAELVRVRPRTFAQPSVIGRPAGHEPREGLVARRAIWSTAVDARIPSRVGYRAVRRACRHDAPEGVAEAIWNEP